MAGILVSIFKPVVYNENGLLGLSPAKSPVKLLAKSAKGNRVIFVICHGLNERKMPKLPNKTEILLKTAQNKACFNDTQDIFVK